MNEIACFRKTLVFEIFVGANSHEFQINRLRQNQNLLKYLFSTFNYQGFLYRIYYQNKLFKKRKETK